MSPTNYVFINQIYIDTGVNLTFLFMKTNKNMLT